jgi:hypothetical protein
MGGLAVAVVLASAAALGTRQGHAEARADVSHGRRQGTVVVTAPPGDTLRSATPTFFVQALNFSTRRPLRIRLELNTTPRFDGTTLLDTTLLSPDSSVTIAPSQPIGPGVSIYWRATVEDALGLRGASPVGGPRTAPSWVTLVSPRTGNGVILATRRPRFVWRSAQINEPPGPWEYELRITNLGTDVFVSTELRDTAFTLGVDLEANAPYRWSVTARLRNSAVGSTATSLTSFVIVDTTVVIAEKALLYQNFPNPFPSASSATTCVWFDLGARAAVQLDIYDLRGHHVRRMVPGSDGVRELDPGRYGRMTESNSECDPRFRWDGTDDVGRVVAPGVYLLRMQTGTYTSMKKIMFRGR